MAGIDELYIGPDVFQATYGVACVALAKGYGGLAIVPELVTVGGNGDPDSSAGTAELCTKMILETDDVLALVSGRLVVVVVVIGVSYTVEGT